MKLPRDLTGPELAQLFRTVACEIARQTGNHLRLTTRERGEHHVTIPNHSPLKVGTLAGILSDVSQHLGITKNELLERLLVH